jgi:hypothetical protein
MDPDSGQRRQGWGRRQAVAEAWRHLRRWLIADSQNPEGGRANPTLLGHLAIASGLVVLGLVLYWGVFFTITGISRQWGICDGQLNPQEGPHPKWLDGQEQVPIDDRVAVIGTRIGQLPKPQAPADPRGEAPRGTPPPATTAGQTARLKEQVRELDRGMRMACTVGLFFFSHRNAALSLSTAAGIVSISSLALISKQGWQKSNNAIINVGITSGLVLYTAWTFSQLYGQATNYQSYSTKYSLAQDLIATIDSAVANGSAVIATNQEQKSLNLASRTDMAILISYIDDKLRIIRKPEFSGDSSFAEESFQKIGGILHSGDRSTQQPAN